MDSPTSFPVEMIAPCGMNCGICIGYMREKRKCPGCRGLDELKPRYCRNCKMVTCGKNETSGFCYECDEFPCKSLKALDKRYRTKYGMSMIENLDRIKEIGVDQFAVDEWSRWTCPECGEILSVHRTECMFCGKE